MAEVTSLGTQSVTAAWANFGAEINTDGHKCIGLWLDVTINNSTDVRIRALAVHTPSGDQYKLTDEVTTASVVAVAEEYYELTNDVNQLIVIPIALNGVIPSVQFQIMAGTPGATKASIIGNVTIQ